MSQQYRLSTESARQVADEMLTHSDLEPAITGMLETLGDALSLSRAGLVTLGLSPSTERFHEDVWQWPDATESPGPLISRMLQDDSLHERLRGGFGLGYPEGTGRLDATLPRSWIEPVVGNDSLLAVLVLTTGARPDSWDVETSESLRIIARYLSYRLLAERSAAYQAILDYATDLIGVARPGGDHPLYRSPSHTTVLGYSPEELAQLGDWDLFDPEDIPRVYELFEPISETPGAYKSAEVRVRVADGSWQDIDLTVVNTLHHPVLRGFLFTGKNVTARRRAERRLAWLAGHDPLTRLPNRTRFLRTLEAHLGRAEAPTCDVAVFFLDLDGFKRVNDSFGHAAGDKLLTRVAHRLGETVREEDTIARMGGDEFVVLLPGLPDIESVQHMAQRLIDAMRFPFSTETGSFTVEVSIGIAYEQVPDFTADGYLTAADLALYKAKERGRGQAAIYTAEMGESPISFRPRGSTGPLPGDSSFGA